METKHNIKDHFAVIDKALQEVHRELNACMTAEHCALVDQLNGAASCLTDFEEWRQQTYEPLTKEF